MGNAVKLKKGMFGYNAKNVDGYIDELSENYAKVLDEKDKKIFEGVKLHLSPEDFSTSVYKRLAELIYEARENGIEPEAAVILNEFNMSPEKQNEAATVFYNMEIYSDKNATAMELTKSILINKIEQEMAEFKDNSEKMKELIKKRLDLFKKSVLWD